MTRSGFPNSQIIFVQKLKKLCTRTMRFTPVFIELNDNMTVQKGINYFLKSGFFQNRELLSSRRSASGRG
ncbi:hypothetical protein Pr1d_17660 [Bythopirellula goksoeyrii]|uniref:Uncharacterized protein n=1 Tax=Bythopirellula goksoeyrii TaxID=1400387 RepID=A0A5B9QC51_9BACT|nr:hypothetical protein Pr1d_17660 [Bythopirellula goksoeyrii]